MVQQEKEKTPNDSLTTREQVKKRVALVLQQPDLDLSERERLELFQTHIEAVDQLLQKFPETWQTSLTQDRYLSSIEDIKNYIDMYIGHRDTLTSCLADFDYFVPKDQREQIFSQLEVEDYAEEIGILRKMPADIPQFVNSIAPERYETFSSAIRELIRIYQRNKQL